VRAGTTGYFIRHAALTGLFRHAGFEARTAAIAQLGYFMQPQLGYFTNCAILSCWFKQLGLSCWFVLCMGVQHKTTHKQPKKTETAASTAKRGQRMAIDGLRMPLFDVRWHNTLLNIDSQPL